MSNSAANANIYSRPTRLSDSECNYMEIESSSSGTYTYRVPNASSYTGRDGCGQQCYVNQLPYMSNSSVGPEGSKKNAAAIAVPVILVLLVLFIFAILYQSGKEAKGFKYDHSGDQYGSDSPYFCDWVRICFFKKKGVRTKLSGGSERQPSFRPLGIIVSELCVLYLSKHADLRTGVR